MKQRIRERARELGFDDCRFTTAAPPESAPQFAQWLAQGRQGEMGYLARNARKRVDPSLVLAGARTIVTLAASYYRPDDMESEAKRLRRGHLAQGPSAKPSGVIARYARYRDYHKLLGERLRTLTQWLDELGGAETRSLWYVDTGPILERDLAQRAGLGFIGKHTNLISRKLGNWIFLAEILTTAELEPDTPERNLCGSCSRCLAACPTTAITGPFQLDARRCISYLTIELKGPIPVELRPAIGDRIFGCDDCLAACPWNRFAREGQLMKSHAQPELCSQELTELLGLDEAEFRQRFAGTPITRIHRAGLLRNVSVALGNTGDTTSLPVLQQAANDTEPLIAEHARWAIEQIQAREKG